MRLAGGLLVLSTSISCAVTPTSNGSASLMASRSAQLAGCYRVEVGPWSETGQHKGFVPPAEFQLDTALSASSLTDHYAQLAQPEPVRKALPEIRGRRVSEPGVWYRLGHDSLRVEWNNRNIKGGYTLVVRGDSVAGLATTWSHFRVMQPGMTAKDIVDPTAGARGSRVACGS